MGLAAQKSAETGLSIDLLDKNNYPIWPDILIR
jgi:hypothetical protein